MSDFLLFVDTETSDKPLDWRQPYSVPGAWPYIVQLAWVVYTREGKWVKAQNHYLRIPDGVMSPVSVRIHGLTPDFLREHGEDPRAVLQQLHNDLGQYKPLVVGHFMQLDFHLLAAAFHRVGLNNRLAPLPMFCTMQATSPFVQPAGRNLLRLGELYERIFHKPLEGQHNAQVDAYATAQCFFALWRTGDIDDRMLAKQLRYTPIAKAPTPRRWGWRSRYWLLVLGVVAALLLLIKYLLA